MPAQEPEDGPRWGLFRGGSDTARVNQSVVVVIRSQVLAQPTGRQMVGVCAGSELPRDQVFATARTAVFEQQRPDMATAIPAFPHHQRDRVIFIIRFDPRARLATCVSFDPA